MWKQFLPDDNAPGVAYWDSHWDEHDWFPEALAFCAYEPLSEFLNRYTRPRDIVLDGGFGLGQHCIYWREQGRNMVGVDYSWASAKRVRCRDETLPLAVADVQTLPFRSNRFDAYLSGGVLEHFEHGPEQGLREAIRVLKPGGVLVGFMPFLNLERRLRAFFSGETIASEGRLSTSTTKADPVKKLDGWRFHQYLFTKTELEQALGHVGLELLEQKPIGWQWGLRDSPWLSGTWRRIETTIRGRVTARTQSGPTKGSAPVQDEQPHAATREGLLHRVAVSEIGKSAGESVLIRALQECFGHMGAFVARKPRIGSAVDARTSDP
ncbi:MAG: class I SAM-dependent methyltransferase [Acidobacteria bacterium]|nr:MAG: class I SAM-dependent methyltransferase [Acidobacteriota bacterium]